MCYTRSLLLVLAMGMMVQSEEMPDKHPLEADDSWDLHVGRQRRRLTTKQASKLGAEVQAELGDMDPETPYTVMHKKQKKHIPFAGGDTQHGIMIDAGSQGTRLHIYEWDKRFLLDEDDLLDVSHGKKLSFPTSNARWTDKYTPGLDVFAFHKKPSKMEKALRKYLGPLIEFAKTVLRDKADEWHNYPIYLKATGGLRTLPKTDRVRMMDMIRHLMNDHDTFNPFQFEDERARVISGEEEAIYGWVGVNFAKGTLIKDSVGSGVAMNAELTYGTVEMGGASTQIAMFQNQGDVMANLFKLQLGGARHWNVYVHSYLYFGINGAWTRLNGRLLADGTHVNPCLPLGSEVEFSSFATEDEEGHFYPRSDPHSIPYTVNMTNNATAFDYESCSEYTYELLRKQANKDWCDFEMDGNCGMGGIYQPPLPKVNQAIDEFVATSNFVDVYGFLQFGDRAAISEIGDAARQICSLNWQEIQEYNANLQHPLKGKDLPGLPQMCFRAVFVYRLLKDGWEFGDDYIMEAADVINGQKMGWALGCMLYEINTLPWYFRPELLYHGPNWWLISLYIFLGTMAGAGVGFTMAMRMSKKFNKRVRESVFFKKSGLGKSSVLRKSLKLPAIAELEDLYDKASAEEDAKERERNGANENTSLLN